MSPRIPRNSRHAAWPWRHTFDHAIGASRHERGTVLLMVVGVLALLAIIGVVYATIGRADRSASVTVQRQQRITDQSEEIAAYVAKVIGDATFARYVERTEGVHTSIAGDVPWKYRTRGYTYPWTDEHFLSVTPADYATANNAPYSQALPALAGAQGPATWYSKFSPTGDNVDPWQGAAITDAGAVTTRDPRNHGDPYLAVLEPEWLRLTPANPNGALFSIRDWRHISNLSPSGNFVNLANLRRSNNGGFDAPPGFRIGTTTNLAQMSYGLTLRNRTTGLMYPPGASYLPDGTTLANPANPAHWSNNQIYAYQPAVDSAHDPSEYEYVLNQWCDTDGDGFLDARWFELTDLSSMFGTGGTSSPRQLISTRGRVRLFCAARVVDSSAKINVNVASDIIKGAWPNTTFTETFPSGTGTRYLTRDDALPPGLTPADIALNRVLRLSDMNQTLSRMGIATNSLGYGGLPQPAATAYDGQATNYSQYNTIATSDLVGNAAYAALAAARKSGASAVVGVGAQPGATATTTAGDRFDQYDLFAAETRSARNSALYQANAAQRVLRSPFDLSDELELISFFGVNDSSTLSRLEAAVGGRVNNAAQRKFSPLRDNRSRALEMAGRDELDAASMFTTGGAGEAALLAAYTDVRHLLTTVNGSRPMKDEGVAPDPARYNPASTDISAALKVIREYGEIPVGTAPTAAQNTARTQAIQLIFKLYANALAPYTDVEEFPSAWDGTNGSSQARRGLVYGGNAELALRVAAHMTANLVDAFDRDRRLDPATGRPFLTTSTTSTDGLDRNEPTRVGLNLVQVPKGNLPGGVMTDRLFQEVPELNHNAGFNNTPSSPATTTPALPSRLPLQTTASGTSPALPSNTQYPSQVGKMTIFGIEPQPFLTEYGVMALYTDAPNGAGGDADGEGGAVTPLLGGGGNATIKMSTDFGNSDFICELIAFQLNNPFHQDLVLYDPTPTNTIDKHKFYIELAGRYYAFRPQDTDMIQYGADNVVFLKAGKTRTFYALNPGTLKAVGERIRVINAGSRMQDRDTGRNTADEFRDLAKNWIEDQLRKTGSGITEVPIQLTQVDPKDFQPILPSAGPSDPMPDMNLWGESARPQLVNTNNLSIPPHSIAERRVCNLWRTVRARASVSASANDTTGTVNDLTNDILADRTHDPSDPGSNPDGYLFAQREPHGGANRGIDGASANQDDHASDADIGANTGYTAVVWASIRRPTDVKTAPGTKGGTLDSAGRPMRGVLPPWCLEARSDSKWTNAGDPDRQFGLNKRIAPATNDQGNDSDYPGPTNARFKKLKLALASNTPVNEDIALPCAKKANGVASGSRANPIGQTKETVTQYKRDYSQVAVEFHAVGEDALGGAETATAASTAAIRRSRNPALFSRSGDFLLPLAVGPWFDPSRGGVNLTAASSNAASWITPALASTTAADREASWMTLSEALALSCGYYSPQDPNDPFFEFGNYAVAAGPNPSHPPKADRGHLVLNAFTPYLKKGTAQEQPLGSGVPFALSIIDQFRAASGISSTPKNIGTLAAPIYAPEQQTREVSYGGGSTSVASNQTLASLTRREGVLNLNTLTQTTMRAVPFLTPEDDASSFMQSTDAYYSSSGTGVRLFDRNVSEDYDIVPTIIGYRDRSLEQYRQLGALAARSVDFSGTNTRTQKTQFGLITDPIRRESLGFKSLGEIAAVNVFRTAAPSTQADPILDPNSIFRFGERDQNAAGALQPLPMGMLGNSRTAQRISFHPSILSSRSYNLDLNGVPDKQGLAVLNNASALHYPLGGNELPGGYQEKLAIVNAMTNTVAVRSDVFTVYFVIHGYTPDDCDVEGTQPLVPSVAKRYVMVVDRSNMVAPTHKPRILMLKEVPMQ